jgi:hypothetical protein
MVQMHDAGDADWICESQVQGSCIKAIARSPAIVHIIISTSLVSYHYQQVLLWMAPTPYWVEHAE